MYNLALLEFKRPMVHPKGVLVSLIIRAFPTPGDIWLCRRPWSSSSERSVARVVSWPHTWPVYHRYRSRWDVLFKLTHQTFPLFGLLDLAGDLTSSHWTLIIITMVKTKSAQEMAAFKDGHKRRLTTHGTFEECF